MRSKILYASDRIKTCLNTFFSALLQDELGKNTRYGSRALAEAVDLSRENAYDHVKVVGGIGDAAERLLKGGQASSEPMSVTDVYEGLEDVAGKSGEGSRSVLLEKMAEIDQQLDRVEEKLDKLLT